MKRAVRILLWQWTFLVLAFITVASMSLSMEFGLTGYTISKGDEPEGFLAPEGIISLSYESLDAENFLVHVDVIDDVYYHNVYHHKTSGWEKEHIHGDNWQKGTGRVSIGGTYADYEEEFIVAAYTCQGEEGDWSCGCDDGGNCGLWRVESLDLPDIVLPPSCQDGDGDGYGFPASNDCTWTSEDCNDTNANIYPGRAEIPYNGIDDDCNAVTPDDDYDGDTFSTSEDCDDNNSQVYPTALEICDDGIDQNCDGVDAICPPMEPGVILSDNFETGTSNEWDYLNPNSQVNRDVANSGVYALDFIYSSGTTLNTNQYASFSHPEKTNTYYRFYLIFEEDFIHTTEGIQIAEPNYHDITVSQWQGSESLGKIYVDGVATSATMNNAQWNCVEIEVTPDTLKLWMNDDLAYTGSNTGASDTYIQGGPHMGDISGVQQVYVDDVIISTQRINC